MKQELFNEYFYTFDIIGNENKDLLNKTASFDCYGYYSNGTEADSYIKNFDTNTGLNVKFHKIDSEGNEYRFLGWSTQRVTELDSSDDKISNILIDGKIGNKANNFNVYDKNHITEISIANDTTLYAVWEPVLKGNISVDRMLGNLTFNDGTHPVTSASNITSFDGIPNLQVIAKPGEQCRYRVATVGRSVVEIQVEFDTNMTNMYDLSGPWNDNLNPFSNISADGDYPLKSDQTKHSLNRKITVIANSITGVNVGSQSRKFYIPQYLGTSHSYNGNEGVTRYSLDINLSQFSYFWKTFKGDDTEKAGAHVTIYTTTSSGTGGGGGNPTPTPPGGGGGDPTPIPPGGDDDYDDEQIVSTLDELRSRLKIRLQ